MDGSLRNQKRTTVAGATSYNIQANREAYRLACICWLLCCESVLSSVHPPCLQIRFACSRSTSFQSPWLQPAATNGSGHASSFSSSARPVLDWKLSTQAGKLDPIPFCFAAFIQWNLTVGGRRAAGKGLVGAGKSVSLLLTYKGQRRYNS